MATNAEARTAEGRWRGRESELLLLNLNRAAGWGWEGLEGRGRCGDRGCPKGTSRWREWTGEAPRTLSLATPGKQVFFKKRVAEWQSQPLLTGPRGPHPRADPHLLPRLNSWHPDASRVRTPAGGRDPANLLRPSLAGPARWQLGTANTVGCHRAPPRGFPGAEDTRTPTNHQRPR